MNLTFVFPWGFIKIGILILLAMYIIFAAVVARQQTLMSKVVFIPDTPLLKFMVLLHLFASIGVFVLALMLL